MIKTEIEPTSNSNRSALPSFYLCSLQNHQNEVEIFDENLAHISTWLYPTYMINTISSDLRGKVNTLVSVLTYTAASLHSFIIFPILSSLMHLFPLVPFFLLLSYPLPPFSASHVLLPLCLSPSLSSSSPTLSCPWCL